MSLPDTSSQQDLVLANGGCRKKHIIIAIISLVIIVIGLPMACIVVAYLPDYLQEVKIEQIIATRTHDVPQVQATYEALVNPILNQITDISVQTDLFNFEPSGGLLAGCIKGAMESVYATEESFDEVLAKYGKIILAEGEWLQRGDNLYYMEQGYIVLYETSDFRYRDKTVYELRIYYSDPSTYLCSG